MKARQRSRWSASRGWPCPVLLGCSVSGWTRWRWSWRRCRQKRPENTESRWQRWRTASRHGRKWPVRDSSVASLLFIPTLRVFLLVRYDRWRRNAHVVALMCCCRGAQRAVPEGHPPQAWVWASGSETAPGGNNTHTRTHTLCPAQWQSLSAVKCRLVLQNEQSLLFDTMKRELLEKIRRLEEDRQNIDFNSGTNEYQAYLCCIIVFIISVCVNALQLKGIVVNLKRLFNCLVVGFAFCSMLKAGFIYCFFQSGVTIPERRDGRGRVCLVSQRGRRRWPWFQVRLFRFSSTWMPPLSCSWFPHHGCSLSQDRSSSTCWETSTSLKTGQLSRRFKKSRVLDFFHFLSQRKTSHLFAFFVFQAKTALTPLKKKVESECVHTRPRTEAWKVLPAGVFCLAERWSSQHLKEASVGEDKRGNIPRPVHHRTVYFLFKINSSWLYL